MSSNGNGNGDGDESDQGGAGRREVAWRVFAAEYDDADFDYSESDEERAPNYVVTPTGARVNRLFVVGVLTEVEAVSDDVLRGRVVDPTGAFVLYAGQYQPDEMAFLESASPPAFVAVTGKARTFQPEDSDRVFTSIRPESINRVDADTRDRWVVQTAEQTLSRVSTLADALDSGERGDDLRQALEASGVDAGLASGVPLAIDHYGTTKAYLAAVRDLALDSARVVAGELAADDVGPLDLAPGEGGDEAGVDFEFTPSAASEAEDLEAVESGETEPVAGNEAETEPAAGNEAETSPGIESEPAASDDLGEAPTATVDESEPAESPEVEPAEAAGTGAEEAPEAEAGAAPESEAERAPEAETEPEADADVGTGETPEVEDAEDAAELQDEVGTEEPPTVEDEQDTSTDEAFEPETGGGDEEPDLGTAGAGDEMYEFDEEERKEVEEEYGLEFSSGSEVESPEESDLEPPEPEAGAEPDAETADTDEPRDAEAASGSTGEVVGSAEEVPAGSGSAATEAPGASVTEDEDEVADGSEATDEAGEQAAGGDEEMPENLEETVMDRMRELNEGDGVERETLLTTVVGDYDVTPADVEDALESALMSGRCYESGEDTLKPI
jgi:hypothetical protein